ncbi:AAA family ATPase [Kribbella deserti]|uniref:AAA family ATPase n=1 Tax=Kribbella deserti TaxID=1926257 RepID=A0ABV6QD27_9ACTN
MPDNTSASSGAGPERSEEQAPAANQPAQDQPKSKLLRKLRRTAKQSTAVPTDDKPASTPPPPAPEEAAAASTASSATPDQAPASTSPEAAESAQSGEGVPTAGGEAVPVKGTEAPAADKGTAVAGKTPKGVEVPSADTVVAAGKEAAEDETTEQAAPTVVPAAGSENASADDTAAGAESGADAEAGGAGGEPVEDEFDDGLPDNYMDMIIGLPKPVESAKESEDDADGELDEATLAEQLPPNYDDIIIGLPTPKADPGDSIVDKDAETVEAAITRAVEANARAEAHAGNVNSPAVPVPAEGGDGANGSARPDGGKTPEGQQNARATSEAPKSVAAKADDARTVAAKADASEAAARAAAAKKAATVAAAGNTDSSDANNPAAVVNSADAADGDAAAADAKAADAKADQPKTTDVKPGAAAAKPGVGKAEDAGKETAKASPANTASDAAANDAKGASKTDGGDKAEGDTGIEGVEAADGAGDGAAKAGKKAEQSPAEQVAMALIAALMRLREALASSRLPIDVVGADEARQQQKSMLDQLDDYVLPRLVQLEAPVLAVVGGSTGAGKSTLVNTLVGRVVSEPGVLRPTTRSPVLVHNPADTDWFTGDRVLPGLARSSGDAPGGTEDAGVLRLVAADTIPQGLAILDAPDIDSVVEANRELAAQLLAAADLWLFVTTAARYADAVPWDFLKDAAERSTAIAVVLDRVPPGSVEDISGHLAHMLLERGLGDSPMFAIAESEVSDGGLLTPEVVAPVKEWLGELAEDAGARAAVVRRTLQGAVTAMTKKTPAFAQAVQAQADTVTELRAAAETAYVRAVKDISKATQDGSMLRGEVLARWQEFVGTGELLKGLQTNVGRFRDKMRSAISGKAMPVRDVTDAVESGLESLLREHAEAAAERAEESWQSTVAGRQLLDAGDRDLGRASREFNAEAGRMVRDWQGYVLELVRKEGADKRSTARVLAYGVNGLGIALMIVIFASTAGIPTGAEVGVGAGTAAVGQKVLEAVFGDQAVRTLATKARRDLDSRVRSLMDAELSRYLTVLDQHPVDPDAPRRLTEAARAVEDCT